MRRAARKDLNQAAIVKALRDAGAYVYDIGLPVDILCGYKNRTLLMELKSGSKKRLTPLQADFFANWTGGTLCRVDSPEAALMMLRALDANPTT
jgi:hypothetical protein